VAVLFPFLTMGGVLLLAAVGGFFMIRWNVETAWFITGISIVGLLAFMEAAIILSGVVL
jgi:hypothetical protein